MRFSGFVLLIVCALAQARDPFRPKVGVACLKPVEPLAGWRLQGIIGREQHFHGWLLNPQNKSLKVQSGQAFPLPPWQLDEIGRRSLTLSVMNSCSGQQAAFNLKGPEHDKNHSAADNGAFNAAVRQ